MLQDIIVGDFFQTIYQHRADAYHRMIAREDADGRLLPTIDAIVPLQGRRILDLGSGTGRFSLLFAPIASEFVALDLHLGMLREQQRQRAVVRGRWPLIQADLRQLPVESNWADVVTVGWAMGHFQSWHAPNWISEVDCALHEMQRVLKPQGTIIIAETLGTGTKRPEPPTASLSAYYKHLETRWGFSRKTIATDYQFDSAEAAAADVSFFFPHLVPKITAENWHRIPEWTGIWSRQFL